MSNENSGEFDTESVDETESAPEGVTFQGPAWPSAVIAIAVLVALCLLCLVPDCCTSIGRSEEIRECAHACGAPGMQSWHKDRGCECRGDGR